MSERSKFQAIIQAKCPQCREGNMFSGFNHTNKHCPVCGLRFEREPSFFYGSMYISYAFSVAIVLTVGFTTNILGNDPPLWVYMVAITVAILLASPLSFRYSRTLMLHLFGGVKYKPNYLEELQNKLKEKK
ncbi:MAG: DUF983 domain-containing protein [Microscillaceae bacterium]|nr:DUF983 domain-containing protein [Microscillaceae bacterium]